MEVIEILQEVSKRIYQNVKDLAGTEDAAGDFGRGAGGDISCLLYTSPSPRD